VTNKDFLKYIDDYVSHPEIEEHARKLVAVAEEAKKVAESDKYHGECEECGSQYDLLAEDVAALIIAYKNLEGGEE